MSKQSRIPLIVALTLLFAFPVDAMAGGFGIFKRCRISRTVCCPPPVCQPCPPASCEPTPAPPCDPCETKTEEPTTIECWYAVGTGMNGSEYCSFPGPCANSPEAAIYAAYYSQGSCQAFSFSLYPHDPCPCPTATSIPEKSIMPDQGDVNEKPGANSEEWWAYVAASINANSQPVILRARGADPVEAVTAANARFPAGWQRHHIFTTKR